MTDFTVADCHSNGIWSDGTGNVITNVEATHNIHGIDVGEHAKNNRVVRNYLHHNDRMAANTPGAFDDYGAVGVVVRWRQHRGRLQHDHRQLGGVGRLRHRRFGGRDLRRHRHLGAPQHRQQQPDLHRAGQQPLSRHDLRLQPVTSSLQDTEFLITRGDADYFGPVRGTVAVNNSVKLTGANSLGFSCYAGCTPAIRACTTTCSTSPAGSATSRAP